MPINFNRITSIGFRCAGKWCLTNDKLEFELEEATTEAKNVVYAFVTNGALSYIGKTAQSLKDRMQRYKTPAKDANSGGSTNIKNNKNIRDSLSGGNTVEIYVLVERADEHYHGFKLNFATAVEDSLIADLMPPWNGRSQDATTPPPRQKKDCSTTEASFNQSKLTPKLTVADFTSSLSRQLKNASLAGATYLDVQSGTLHRCIGGYPGKSHSMPVCCSVMRKEMKPGDHVLSEPPKGKGAKLLIRYQLPRLP